MEFQILRKVSPKEIDSTSKIISSQYLLTLKKIWALAETTKAILVAQRPKVTENPYIVHNSATLRHSSLRIIISCATIVRNLLWTQDGDHKYIQTEEPLWQPIFWSYLSLSNFLVIFCGNFSSLWGWADWRNEWALWDKVQSSPYIFLCVHNSLAHLLYLPCLPGFLRVNSRKDIAELYFWWKLHATP